MWVAGCGWTIWMWLVGVVVRRYIDFLIFLIPTPLVSVIFSASPCISLYHSASPCIPLPPPVSLCITLPPSVSLCIPLPPSASPCIPLYPSASPCIPLYRSASPCIPLFHPCIYLGVWYSWSLFNKQQLQQLYFRRHDLTSTALLALYSSYA